MLQRLQVCAPTSEPVFDPRQDRRSIRDHHQRCGGSQRALYGRATIRKGAHGDQRDCRGGADGDVLRWDLAPFALAHARSRIVLVEPPKLVARLSCPDRPQTISKLHHWSCADTVLEAADDECLLSARSLSTRSIIEARLRSPVSGAEKTRIGMGCQLMWKHVSWFCDGKRSTGWT